MYLKQVATFGMMSWGLLAGAEAAQAQGYRESNRSNDWDTYIGGGVVYAPEYEGSDRSEFDPVLEFEAIWRDRFLIGSDGLGVFVVNNDNFRVSAGVGYGGGRKESDSAYLRGLGDIDNGAVFELGMQYDIGIATATADVRRFASGSEGTLVSLGLQTEAPFGVLRGALAPTGTRVRDAVDDNGLALFGGLSFDWADDKYNQSYFGVSAAQSTVSGLRQHTAGAGFKSANLDLGFAMPLGAGLGLTGVVTYSRLLGSVEDSPLVKTKNNVSAALAISYEF